MMVSVDLVILMEVLAVAVMVLLLIGHLEVLVVGLAVMVDMAVEMILVVVLGVMVVVVVVVAMQVIEENRRLATLAAMVPTWGALVVDMVAVA